MGRIRIVRTGAWLATASRTAATPRQRMVGLLGHAALAPGEALIFPRCRSIHTIGMRFAIDVVFVDRHWRVVAIKPEVPPGRPMIAIWQGWAAIELSAGTAQRLELKPGDQLAPEGAESC